MTDNFRLFKSFTIGEELLPNIQNSPFEMPHILKQWDMMFVERKSDFSN